MRTVLCGLVALLLSGVMAPGAQAQLELLPPETTITEGPEGATKSPSAVFAFTSSEEGSTFRCTLNAEEVSPCPSPQSYADLADGTYVFAVAATGAGGLTDPTPDARTFTVDTVDRTPPETTITGGPSGTTTSPSAVFGFTSSEAGATFRCTLNDDVDVACTSPKAYLALPDGKYVFTVTSTDEAGNEDPTPETRAFTVDTVDRTPPQTTITGGRTGSAASTSAVYSFVSSEAGSTFRCTLNGEVTAGCDSPQTYSKLAVGPYVFTVAATDKTGNEDPTPDSRTFTVAAPTPTPTPTPTRTPTPTPSPTPTPTPTPAATPAPATASAAPPVAGPPAASKPTAPGAADVTGPRFTLSVLRTRMRASRSGVVRFTLRPVAETATGIISLRTTGRGTGSALGSLAFRSRPGRATPLRVVLTRKALTALKRTRRIDARGTVILRDAAGNATIKPFGFTLTAPASARGR